MLSSCSLAINQDTGTNITANINRLPNSIGPIDHVRRRPSLGREIRGRLNPAPTRHPVEPTGSLDCPGFRGSWRRNKERGSDGNGRNPDSCFKLPMTQWMDSWLNQKQHRPCTLHSQPSHCVLVDSSVNGLTCPCCVAGQPGTTRDLRSDPSSGRGSELLLCHWVTVS